MRDKTKNIFVLVYIVSSLLFLGQFFLHAARNVIMAFPTLSPLENIVHVLYFLFPLVCFLSFIGIVFITSYFVTMNWRTILKEWNFIIWADEDFNKSKVVKIAGILGALSFIGMLAMVVIVETYFPNIMR